MRRCIVVLPALLLFACEGDAGSSSVIFEDASTADGGARSDAGTPRSDASTPRSDGGTSSDASTGSPDSGGSTAGTAWRPFSAASPWNTPIAANSALASDSASLVDDFRSSSPYGEHLDVNISGFSVPLYFVDSSTPTHTVTCDLGGQGFSGSNGMNATASVPIPAGAEPDPQSDHHLLIVDKARNLEWGMWATEHNGSTWTCGVGATADLAGTGLRPYKPDLGAKWYEAHGARACGFPLSAGLIRVEELEAGAIEHALVVAYPHIRAGFYMSPASTAQARSGDNAISTRGIPCGGRIQLDPSLDVESLGLNRAGKIIAKALQKYGAYVGDYSGALSLYAENSDAAKAKYAGTLANDALWKLDLARLRVLQFGKLTDDGNGG